MSTTVRSAAVIDELVGDDGAVILIGRGLNHRVVRLSPMGQAVREIAQAGIPLEALGEALVARFGTPDGDVMDTVRAVVRTLESEGVLVVRE